MNRIVASAQISLMDYNDAIVTGSMPTNPEKDMLWLNTSVNPHIMKQYTGSEWIIVGELDPEYTEKLEVITGNITDLELTLGNMADDGKLDYGDRQEIVDKLLPIIGYLPVNTSVTLKTVNQLDADKKGSFYQLRQAAQNAGIVASSTAYTGLASAWNSLRAYLGGLDPKPWDLSTVNQDAVTQVDKGTFRTHWLNYYNAEYTLATATTQILHSAISTINTTTLPAMRDSALSSAEKTAIKQSLIILSSEKTAMDGEIIGLKANPKFENQTPLNEAKSAYDTSYTSVTTAINAVLAVPTGTLIPSTLILGVENAVSSYSAKLSLLKKAMQDSQTAIAEKVSGDASKELSDSLKGYVDKITYGQDIEEIQNQVDGAIMTWFGNNEPTLLTAPAKDWNTTALKDVHLGDLYYDNISGYGYRFGKDGTLYRWIRIVDADVVAALAAAQNAQDTADGKRRAFYSQPTPPYDIGDLWVQGATGELMRATVTKPKGGLYHESDWVKATKYTDDTVANSAVTAASNAQSAANKAQEDATKANNAVSDIISDNKMTPDEKVILQREWLNIQYERNEILSQAERYVIDNASYRSVYDTLNGYLAPFFTNLTTTQDVNGETLRSNFQRYYEQRQAILDAISVAAQQKVLDLQTQVDAGPFADKTDVLSGTEIFTDKADDSVVHVDIDGKSYQYKGSRKNLAPNMEFWQLNGAASYDKEVITIPVGGENSVTFWVRWDGAKASQTLSMDSFSGTGFLWNAAYFAEDKVTAVVNTGGVHQSNGNALTQVSDRRKADTMPEIDGNVKWVKHTFSGNSLYTPSDVKIKNVMITSDASIDYEPPVPTPDYPIAIHSLNDFDVVSTQLKYNLDYSLDFYRNTDLIVTDPTKKIYADSSVPNPPVGAVFNNLNIRTNLIARTNIDFPAVHNTVMVLIKLYEKTNDAQYLNRALLIGDYVLSRGFEASFYGSMMYLIPNRVSLVGGQWKNINGEINLRTLYQALNVTTSLYRITNDTKYSVVATKLMKTIGNAHNNVNVRVTRDSELEQYMFGASYDLIYVNEQNNMTYGWMNFNQSNADILVESIKHYVAVFGNSIIKDWEGTSFAPQSIINNFGSHIKAIHANGMLTMSGTGLPYNFFDYGTGGVNWDWVDNTGRGNKWFAGDAILWIIKGIADLGKTDVQLRVIASIYRNNFYNLMVKTHSSYPNINQRALFYDRYNFDGTHLTEDDSLSTSSTALLWMIDEDLGIADSSLHSKMFSTLVFHMYKNNENSNFDGSYGWDAATADALVEVKATGEIYLSKFFETFTKEYPNPHTSDKINILLSEPLRSVGNVKDRLFLDSDGLWKVERNVGEVIFNGDEKFTLNAYPMEGYYLVYTIIRPISESAYPKWQSTHFKGFSNIHVMSEVGDWIQQAVGNGNMLYWIKVPISLASDETSFRNWLINQKNRGTPLKVLYEIPLRDKSITILHQSDQDKLNNIQSYKGSSYLYTIVDKTNVLPNYVRDNLKPNLRATFKSQAWYQNYKRGDDLRHFVEVKGLDRAIRFGMLVDYQSFVMPIANWLYFCKVQTNTDDFREELVDEDGSIFDYTTQREIRVPKQALDLRGVAEGTTGYLAFDTRNQLMWFIHYQRNYTYTTNQETGIIEKIPSSEYWIKWNPGKTGHNTQLVLDESVYIVGEIER